MIGVWVFFGTLSYQAWLAGGLPQSRYWLCVALAAMVQGVYWLWDEKYSRFLSEENKRLRSENIDLFERLIAVQQELKQKSGVPLPGVLHDMFEDGD